MQNIRCVPREMACLARKVAAVFGYAYFNFSTLRCGSYDGYFLFSLENLLLARFVTVCAIISKTIAERKQSQQEVASVFLEKRDV